MVRRDDVEHPGESVAWGRWAITSNDPDFRGKGAQDSGEDYGPAPGTWLSISSRISALEPYSMFSADLFRHPIPGNKQLCHLDS